jgi:hypothetical protein
MELGYPGERIHFQMNFLERVRTHLRSSIAISKQASYALGHRSLSILQTMISRIEPPYPARKRRRSQMGGVLIRTLRSRYPKPLKELLESAGTQPQKFEMRPVWGASHFGSKSLSPLFNANLTQ